MFLKLLFILFVLQSYSPTPTPIYSSYCPNNCTGFAIPTTIGVKTPISTVSHFTI